MPSPTDSARNRRIKTEQWRVSAAEWRPRLREALASWRDGLALLAGALALTQILWAWGVGVGVAAATWLLWGERSLAIYFALETLVHLVLAPRALEAVRGRLVSSALLVVLALSLALGPGTLPWLSEAVLLVVALRGLQRLGELGVQRLALSPGVLLPASFLILILAGSGLLMLPRATTASLGYLDALFTSTSATCVTGLAVVDIGSAYTRMGQSVIMILIQIGGLGLVTCTSFLAFFLGGSLSLRERQQVRHLLSAPNMIGLGRLLAAVLVSTLVIEALGALGFWLWGQGAGHAVSPFWALFHSVSAFCNAGFALMGDSLVPLGGISIPAAIAAALFVIGGFGFIASVDVLRALPRLWRPRRAEQGVTRILRRPEADPQRSSALDLPGLRPSALALQTRIIIAMTIALLLLGTIGLLGFEWHRTSLGAGFAERLGAAAFQSASTRTAGFNTIDLTKLSAPSALLMIALMFVGASPGSTAGGIKTVTLALILLSLRAKFRRESQVQVLGRTIPQALVEQAMVVGSLSASAIGAAVLILSATEQAPFLHILFEAVSAFGTVGLSLGLTPELTPTGKLVIMALMFLGRVGPLTLFMTMAHKAAPPQARYPAENVVIG